MTFKQWFKEMAGTGAIVKNCKPTADYQVWGACSDLKKKRKVQEAMAVSPVKPGKDYQVWGKAKMKKMSGMGNPGGISVKKESK